MEAPILDSLFKLTETFLFCFAKSLLLKLRSLGSSLVLLVFQCFRKFVTWGLWESRQWRFKKVWAQMSILGWVFFFFVPLSILLLTIFKKYSSSPNLWARCVWFCFLQSYLLAFISVSWILTVNCKPRFSVSTKGADFLLSRIIKEKTAHWRGVTVLYHALTLVI